MTTFTDTKPAPTNRTATRGGFLRFSAKYPRIFLLVNLALVVGFGMPVIFNQLGPVVLGLAVAAVEIPSIIYLIAQRRTYAKDNRKATEQLQTMLMYLISNAVPLITMSIIVQPIPMTIIVK